MGIGSVTSTSSMSSVQTFSASSTDPKIKNIQNEISDAKQQMQKLSSKEEITANEKASERKKLQKEISDLNTKLQQHQEELRKSQKRELLLAELQGRQDLPEEENPQDKVQTKEALPYQAGERDLSTDSLRTESQETVISRNSDGTVILRGETNSDVDQNVDTDIKQDDQEMQNRQETQDDQKMHAMVSADASVQQANRQGTIVAKTRDGIAILKGEMNLDELRGADTEKKQAELEKMEKKEERATKFQFSLLGEANNAMKSATGTNTPDATNQTQANVNAENNVFFNAMNLLQDNNNLWIGRLL